MSKDFINKFELFSCTIYKNIHKYPITTKNSIARIKFGIEFSTVGHKFLISTLNLETKERKVLKLFKTQGERILRNYGIKRLLNSIDFIHDKLVIRNLNG